MKEYNLNTVKTNISRDEKHFQNWDELKLYSAEKITNIGHVLFFFDHKVIWAKWDGNSFEFNQNKDDCDISNLQMMRLFNEDKELFVRRIEATKWFCRLREDEEGNEAQVIDARQYLLGESQGEGEFSELWESSGSAKEVPISIAKGNRAFITTRNYIGFADDLLANFEDSRFLSIEEVS